MSKKILVVDDSPTDMKRLTLFLKSKGYSISTATDGEKALEAVLEDKPDLMLLDIMLPKKNGFQVCREVKTGTETKDIKVILVTSKNQATDRFWGLKQGADGYLTKPFEDQDLVTLLKEHM
ncbi:MAG: twitching motility two-component system response regulator PilH [bacterium]|nr:MAG: twitching motility two-component system response regulator PilH [bacterium]